MILIGKLQTYVYLYFNKINYLKKAPHDFVIEGEFSADADKFHGFMPRDGAGWYRKKFNIPKDWEGKAIWLYFEGVFAISDYWVNGNYIKRHS